MSSLPEPLPDLHFVRIAGLPVEELAPFGGPLCGEKLAALEAAEAALATSRSALVDAIYPLVNGAAPEARRSLLAVKRDAFNGRAIAGHARRPEWEQHLGDALPAAAAALADEAAAAAALAAFEAAHQAETGRELGELAGKLRESRIRRALALSSHLAAGQLEKLSEAAAGGEAGRREKKRIDSALRYLSRAALKLSPFSAFTPLALAAAHPGAEAIALAAAETRETPLTRVQPAFLDQVNALLLAHPAFQSALEAEVNPTLEPLPGGVSRWFRPGHWFFDRDKGAMTYTLDAFLKSALKDPVMARLGRTPGARFASLAALAGELAAEFPELPAEQILLRLEKLRRLGFLLLYLPWPSNSPKLETAMAKHLQSAADPGLAELGRALAELATGEDALPEAASAGAAIAALDRRVDAIWSLARELEPGAGAAPYHRVKENQFFDDVLRAPAASPAAPLLRLSAGRLADLLAEAEPLVHLASVGDVRFDFLHQLDSLLAENWGEAGEAGLFEVFDRAKPLFSGFGAHEKDPGRPAVFNPGGLPAVAELAGLRQRIFAAADAASAPQGELARVDSGLLRRAAAEIPAAYRCEVGPCLFLQPADGEGRQWVVNRLYEGTGRYSSRYTALLPPDLYQRFAAPWMRGGGDGSAARPFLLDLIHAQGDTLNVHRALTARLLVHPGDRVDPGAGRTVSLAELRVRRVPGGLPILTGAAGQRYLPVQLGGAARRFLPTLFRFLSLFGPSELQPRLPASLIDPIGSARVRRRLVLGELILQRRRWIFEQEDLPAELFGAPDAAAFRAVDAWRRRHGMPAQVFLIENVHHPTRQDLYKPQYLDLGSPLFVSLLRSALKSHHGVVSLEEMLPLPAAAARDPAGRGWLFELMAERPQWRSPE